MRHVLNRVLGILALFFFFSAVCLAQANLRVNEAATRVQLQEDRTGVELAVENAGRETVLANVSLELVSTFGFVQSSANTPVTLPPGRTNVNVAMPPAFAQNEREDRENLLWYRLRYRVTPAPVQGRDAESVQGILSVSEAAPKLFELHVAAPSLVAAGSRVELRVRAVHPVTLHPIEGVRVQAILDPDSGDAKPVQSPPSRTDRQGFATLAFALPRDGDSIEDETIDVKVTGKLGSVSEEADGELYLNHFLSTLLNTDKSIYQPGQMVHARLMAFGPDHKAIANQTVHFEIRDPDENLVFRASAQSSRFGVASADWPTPENLRLGTYEIQAIIGEERGSTSNLHESIKISRYDLPAFSVGVKPDRAYYLPGQDAEVEVRADYLFGEPVQRGHVRIAEEAERRWNFREQKWDIKEASSREGETDEQGRYQTRADLSAEQDDLSGNDYQRFRDISFTAYFTDSSTGRTEERRFDIRVTKQPIHVYVIPGSEPQPSGLPLEFYLSTDYADGTPAECEVEIQSSAADLRGVSTASRAPQILRRVRTNRYGVAKVAGLNVPGRNSSEETYIIFRARDGKGLVGSHTESGWAESRPGVRVETNKTLYAPNDPIGVELSASEQNLFLVVDAVHEGQVLASRLVHVRRGRASILFPPSEKFQNEVTIVAYGLGARNDDRFDNIAGSHSVYFPKNHALHLNIRLSKPAYRPGDEASATVLVSGPGGDPKESAVGLLVVDKAVEELERTDRDFRGNSDFLHMRTAWNDDEELNGIHLGDFDKLDLAKPLPDGFELAAEALLQMHGGYPDIFGSEAMAGDLRKTFASEIDPVLNPVRDALASHYEGDKEYPKTEAAMKSELAARGIRMEDLVDPWGTQFRVAFQVRSEMDVLELTSAGPDKTFDTEDDFPAIELKWPYFKPYSEAIQKAIDEFHMRTGGYIRSRETLSSELARSGIDLAALRDPWGHPYAVEFGAMRTRFVVTVASAGPDGRFDTTAARSYDDFSLGTFGIDYFSETLAALDAALNKSFKNTHSFPETVEQLERNLQDSGIAWGGLQDPWGRPYYATFNQKAVYSDRINVESYESYVAKGAPRTEIVPVTRQLNFVYIWSAGEDGMEGTSDDYYVASFSRAAFEQPADGRGIASATNGVSLSGSNGAISGTVKDISGAVIPGADVNAVDSASGYLFHATADENGVYVLRNLPPGSYEVRFESAGFRISATTGVPVRSSTITQLDAILQVGTQSQMVMVSEAVPKIETTNSAVAAVVTGTKGTSAPLQAMTPRLRQYFPETLLWQPELVTDGQGRAKLKFPLADNITTWKLSAIASTESGETGTVEKEIRSFQPFFVEHDPPKFLTAGDEIELPVVLRNYLDHSLRMTASLKPEPWFTSLSPASVSAAVPSRGYQTEIFKFLAAATVKNGKQRITANGAETGDAIERTVTVRPNGEELTDVASRIFEQSAGLDVRIPEYAIPGSLETSLKIYPNLDAHLLESVEAIMGRPYGCAEQTISAAYPSLLVLRYTKNMRGVSPAVIAQARRYVQLGTGRLLSYQAPDGGITYWGRGDADAALTAYAMQFLSAAREFTDVDESIAQANLSWLVRHQQDDGRWIAPTWGGPEDARRTAVLTAYIARVVAATKVPATDTGDGVRLSKGASTAVARALEFLAKQVGLYDEPYLIASYVLASRAAGENSRAAESLARLRKLEHREGEFSYWSLETNTPFYGWGLAGRIETTALVLQALEQGSRINSSEDPLVSRGLLFLLHNEDRLGIWYSTQATVNVLEALHALTDRMNSGHQENAAQANTAASVLVDGRRVLTINLPAPGELTAPFTADLSKFVSPGPHHLEIVRGAGGGAASVQWLADYYVPWVQSPNGEDFHHEEKSSDSLRLGVHYDKQSAAAGDVILCTVQAERVGFRGYGMILAEIGLPPGAEVDRNSVETAMKASGWDINQYEVLPDRLVVYLWPHAGGTKFSFTFKPRFGMKALAPASTLYDYYNPEARAMVQPVQFTVR